MVEISGLGLTYNLPRKKNIAALDNVNVKFDEGKISVIIGPSGCGKTSLIRIMAGLLKPSRGEVFVSGEPVRGVRNKTSVIFQDYGLLPWKTVRANAELPLRLNGVRRRLEDNPARRADELLSGFGLGEFAKYYPNRLSGGMKQRLAIVRALVTGPELLLMDEPFSSLDAITREEAQDYFLAARKELKATIIMVSHSIEEAVYLGDTVYVMNGRNPGTLNYGPAGQPEYGHGIAISREGESYPRFRENPRFQEYCRMLRGMLKTENPEAAQ